ncbi:hypothetical protein PHISCL_03352 [Aspergillus sclerotialis]|uniref:Uncharacterized protein n=1 Tax=Aspergillus sclerotialis TaxID=2070753 RepID=A0A3A2ZSE0_9EURO|nr:hypothetical protein PHISCL_03352 [Aspergillus sclerotialis]
MRNTMKGVLRRLRGKSTPHMSPEIRELLILFSQSTGRSQSRLSGRTELSYPRTGTEIRKPHVEASTDLAWIEDTWLCSCQNSVFLGEAEEQWKNGRPQQALIIAERVLSSKPNLKEADKLKCRLFIAALVHYGGKHEESNKLVDDALRMIQQQQCLINYAQAREVRGIAHFIQGKNLMGLKKWNLAYWTFSQTLYTPGYHSKAQYLQKEAIGNCKRDDASNE